MRCGNCGKENPDTQQYCMNCGQSLYYGDIDESEYEDRPKRRRKMKPKTVLITMLILLPLILFLMFILLLFFLGSGV